MQSQYRALHYSASHGNKIIGVNLQQWLTNQLPTNTYTNKITHK